MVTVLLCSWTTEISSLKSVLPDSKLKCFRHSSITSITSITKPVGVILCVMKAGSDNCELPTNTTEEDEKGKEGGATGLVTEIGVDDVVVTVFFRTG